MRRRDNIVNLYGTFNTAGKMRCALFFSYEESIEHKAFYSNYSRFSSSIQNIAAHEEYHIQFNLLEYGNAYIAVCAMGHATTSTKFYASRHGNISFANVGSTSATVSHGFIDSGPVRCVLTNDGVSPGKSLDVLKGTRESYVFSTSLVYSSGLNPHEFEFTSLSPSTKYDVYCVQGFQDFGGNVVGPAILETFAPNVVLIPISLSKNDGRSITATLKFSTSSNAGCAAFVSGVTPTSAESILAIMSIPAKSGRYFSTTISTFGEQRHTILPGRVYDLYCAQAGLQTVLGPKTFTTPSIISETKLSDISTKEVVLSTTFSVTGKARCAIYLATSDIVPTADQIYKGTSAVGNQPTSLIAQRLVNFKVSYGGLTQDTPYHVYCAQNQLVTRLAYFRTRSAYCSIQPINIREVDRRFHFSQPATRFFVAGRPEYERDPPSCSLRYKNSILLMFPEHFPLATGKEVLRIIIGAKTYTYPAELYENSTRIDSTNALVFRDVFHSVADTSSSIVLEIDNVSTAIQPGRAGSWKILICDHEGWEVNTDKRRYRGRYKTPETNEFYENGDLVSHENKIWQLNKKLTDVSRI